MIFLTKKPNGYVYIDLYKKRCFETIRDIIASAKPTILKREYTSSECVVFVPSEYYDYVDGLISVQPYVQNILEISDDYVSENIHKLADTLNNVNTLNNTYKVVNTASYKEDATVILSSVRGYILNKSQFNALLVAASLSPLS